MEERPENASERIPFGGVQRWVEFRGREQLIPDTRRWTAAKQSGQHRKCENEGVQGEFAYQIISRLIGECPCAARGRQCLRDSRCAAARDAGSVVRKVSEVLCAVRRLSLTNSLHMHAARSRHYAERPLHCCPQRATQRVLRVLHSTTWYVRPLRFSIVLGGLTCGRSLERRWNAR